MSNIRTKKWFRAISYALIPLYVFLCLLTLEYMNYRQLSDIYYMWSNNYKKLIFAFIVLTLISVIIAMLVKKLWIYATVFGALSIIVSLINCIKLAVNGDYFFPWDVTMAGNMGELVSFARFDIPPLFFVFVPIIVVFCLVFWLAGTGIGLRWFFRIPSVLVVIVLFLTFYKQPKLCDILLNSFGMDFNDSVLQASNYNANGFTNAFTINCLALNVREPEGYSSKQISEYLSEYKTRESQYTGNESPDVIVILSEAFSDIRTLNGTTFSRNPLENYDSICARRNALSGGLFTTALGGGTVRTEMEILTGLSIDGLVNGTSPYIYVTKDTETYVSNYKKQGYNTIAIHPYDGKFYMRNTTYPFFGFDEFITQDEVERDYDAVYRRFYITDQTFMNVVKDKLEQNTDKPNFIFGITMENHQSYTKSEPEDIVIDVTNDSLSADMLDAVTTYTQGVFYSDMALADLVDYIDKREKSTVLLYFGDHLPSLGPNQLAYKQAGNVDDIGGYDMNERLFLYRTPYLMYANYDIDYGILLQNSNVSAYYMLSLLADVTGTAATPYMQYLSANFIDIPFYNVRLQQNLNQDETAFADSLKIISYDRIRGKRYSVTP